MLKENSHVARLNRYLPFDPAHSQIYEEYQKTADSLNLETVALRYLNSAAKLNSARLIILTGDAGHGKTHLCRRLIQDCLGYDEESARRLINSACNAERAIDPAPGSPLSKSIYIHKDFSELEPVNATALIETAINQEETIYVICANEGRLRAVLESETTGEACCLVLENFNTSFKSGLCVQDPRIHIINLNYQSVSGGEDESLAAEVFDEWLDDGRRWQICSSCDASVNCPILNNRKLLEASASDIGKQRRARLVTLFSALEQLGVVFTIRELLMVAAYIITGGLKCHDVHGRYRKSGWQHEYTFYNSLFTPPRDIKKDKLYNIPVISDLQRLDPGLRAFRAIDEKLINEQNVFPPGELDLMFANNVFQDPPLIDASQGIDEIIGNPSSRNERNKEAGLVQRIVRSLRRRAFFDEDCQSITELSRLGFQSGSDFIAVTKKTISDTEMHKLKSRILRGLHIIQGLQMSEREISLHLVDPAFGSATTHAAIIAGRIPARAIQVLPMGEVWAIPDDLQVSAITKSVNWIDRHIVLRFEMGTGFADLNLDMMSFDCVCRAGSGYVAEEFYAHDLKRIKNFLARLAERGQKQPDEINLFIRGAVHSVSIDNGIIQVGGDL
ncbi:hypothetical protein [uncultured Thalassospira sp.]|uniref:hypothetical protein n=1 Tax=uncultured Thalassospira sp. TaxID=404382 RepID=UPI0030DAC026|tara:strand:+ start:584 stop:2431 length:1848 start_codon:yes stop_codon:yes gene_type:complete